MTRADLHRLVDELPEASLDVVAVYLERAKDPELIRLGAVEWDDEPVTPEEEAEAAAARAEIARGEGIAWEEVKAELRAAD